MRYTNQLLSRFLDTNGDGTGVTNAVGDYSSAAEDFYIQPGVEQRLYVARMIVSYRDTVGVQAEEYGNLGAALTNGIKVLEEDSAGEVQELTGGIPITTNAEWGQLCYDVTLNSWGAGDEFIVVRYTFERHGRALILDGAAQNRLVVRVNDNLTGLVHHRFLVQGYWINWDLP